MTDRPDRRRPLLATAAAITLITGTALVLAQRHPHDATNISGPDTTQPTHTSLSNTTATDDPTTNTTTTPIGATSTVLTSTSSPSDDDGVPPASMVALSRPVGLAATVQFLPDGASVLVATVPDEYTVDENGVVETGSDSGEFSAQMLDIATGDVVHEFPWASGPYIFSDDGSRYFDGQSLWDLTTGGEIGDRVGITGLGNAGPGASATLSADGSLLALAIFYRIDSFDLVLVDATDGSTRWRADAAMPFTSGATPQVRFSDDGSTIYLGDQIHDLASGDRLDGIPPFPTEPSDGFWKPDLVNSLDGRLEQCLLSVTAVGFGGNCDIASDGSRLAMLSDSRDRVDIWEIDQFSSFPTDRGIAPTYTLDVVDGIGPPRFLPGGEEILVGNSNGNTEYIYDIETAAVVREFPGDSGNGTFAPKLFNADATRYFDGEHLWDLTTDAVVAEWDTTFAAGFSPDGTTLARASSAGTVEMIDVSDGSTRWQGPVVSLGTAYVLVQFSDDGSAIFVGGEVLDAATGEPRPDLAALVPNRPTAGFWDPSLVETLDAPYDSCDERPPGYFFCDIASDGSRIAMFHSGVLQIWVTDV